jgi:hypothetical protein
MQYDKVIYSVKHNTYIVINTLLATCFGSSEPSSGQYLIYRHGAFSECAHYEIPYCIDLRWFTRTETCCQLRINDYICVVFE